MQLSKNFWLSELTRSQTASRYGMNNQPDAIAVDNLKSLCFNVLQPVRDHFQKPVIVSSGYRSPRLNARIGGSETSQHCKGQAADFEIPGLPNKKVAAWIKNNLDFDQLILEFYNPKSANSGWIHCSYVDSNRKQALTYDGVRFSTFA
ncbi:MAG: D-Ala-D-Ala carboxypeptidase family metallohydrolase [Pleurocapsa sp. MO_226.B13]|nr:D-Ala-D-Ala carboxypeptidase family metallohydrolase [Pleurocapsa sp. MO_226.B13]